MCNVHLASPCGKSSRYSNDNVFKTSAFINMNQKVRTTQSRKCIFIIVCHNKPLKCDFQALWHLNSYIQHIVCRTTQLNIRYGTGDFQALLLWHLNSYFCSIDNRNDDEEQTTNEIVSSRLTPGWQSRIKMTDTEKLRCCSLEHNAPYEDTISIRTVKSKPKWATHSPMCLL